MEEKKCEVKIKAMVYSYNKGWITMMIKMSVFNKTNNVLIVDASKDQISIKLLDSCTL